MSCAMICGEPNIWPKPTGRTKLNSRSATLSTDIISLHMDTRFSEVEQLFRSAFRIFLNDLQNMEAQSIAGGDGNNHNSEEKINSKEAIDDQTDVKRHCDILQLNLKVIITGTLPEVYPHLDIDESYNMTVTSNFAVKKKKTPFFTVT